MTADPQAAGDRVIPGAQIRAAREQLATAAVELAALDCAGRVMSTVGFLLDAGHGFHLTELRVALADYDTVDLALDLLTEAGLSCASATEQHLVAATPRPGEVQR